MSEKNAKKNSYIEHRADTFVLSIRAETFETYRLILLFWTHDEKFIFNITGIISKYTGEHIYFERTGETFMITIQADRLILSIRSEIFKTYRSHFHFEHMRWRYCFQHTGCEIYRVKNLFVYGQICVHTGGDT